MKSVFIYFRSLRVFLICLKFSLKLLSVIAIFFRFLKFISHFLCFLLIMLIFLGVTPIKTDDYVFVLLSRCIPISIFLPLVNILYCRKIYATVFISIFASYLMLSATMVAVLFCAVFKSAREQLHELDTRPRRVSTRRNSQRNASASGRPSIGKQASTRRRYATLGYV